MEPNKFEKKIRDKMENREINPSQELWNRIENKLAVEEAKPRKSQYYSKFWLGVAASIIVLMSISFYLTKEQNEVESEIKLEMVNSETDEILKEKKIQRTSEDNKIDNIILPQKLKTQNNVQIIESIARVQKKEILSDDPVSIKKINEPKLIVLETVKGIDEHIAKLIEKANLIENNTGALTDKEVDSLLRDAQKELFKKEKIRPTKSIDAMALLDEVEYEIDVTLKNKLFEALKKGFMEARSVVAQRNQ